MGNILYRIGNKLYKWKIPYIWIIFKFLLRLLCNCAIDPRTKIGKNSIFAYGGIGTVIHKDAVIGENVMIGPNVVIGGRSGQLPPKIHDNVKIGANACILGNIVVKKNSQIGAGAVVLKDINEGEIWVGVPAKKIIK